MNLPVPHRGYNSLLIGVDGRQEEHASAGRNAHQLQSVQLGSMKAQICLLAVPKPQFAESWTNVDSQRLSSLYPKCVSASRIRFERPESRGWTDDSTYFKVRQMKLWTGFKQGVESGASGTVPIHFLLRLTTDWDLL